MSTSPAITANSVLKVAAMIGLWMSGWLSQSHKLLCYYSTGNLLTYGKTYCKSKVFQQKWDSISALHLHSKYYSCSQSWMLLELIPLLPLQNQNICILKWVMQGSMIELGILNCVRFSTSLYMPCGVAWYFQYAQKLFEIMKFPPLWYVPLS